MAATRHATQTSQPMKVRLPAALAPDDLLLVRFTGQEAVSALFHFRLDLMAENRKAIAFESLLGQPVTVELEVPGRPTPRYFNGICYRLGQGERDADFTSYWMEVVPGLWLLGKRAQSRVFQHQTVPQILAKVLHDEHQLDVAGLGSLEGPWHPRDYCVQYRESDFHFVSRLMEEEGIYYFFTHAAGGHQMVVANRPAGHPRVPEQNPVPYRNAPANEGGYFVYDWAKIQELRSTKYTLWDHCFEMPRSHLDASKEVASAVKVGQVSHPLRFGTNGRLEIYDYPGEYAQRFDGVHPGGGDRSADVSRIFEDNQRTVAIRLAEEALPGLLIQGASNCPRFIAGHQFALTTLKNSLEFQFQADGPYVLTAVHHAARQGNYRTGGSDFQYHNTFSCIPLDLPYRPPRVTPRPVVQGTQTAIVVGPKGEEVFTDKYGRVKVQFHWDRQGKYDADSSCWVRVAQAWAGKRWGASFWPRVGQEVVVAFQEGDPDQPIIVGSVYNADQMPPYLGKGPDSKHPSDNKLTGVKSNTTKGGQGFNEWRFDDTKGKEQIFVHAERDLDQRVKHDSRERVLHDRHLIVGWDKDGQKGGDQRELVYQDKHLDVKRHHVEHVGGNMQLLVGGGEGDNGNQDTVIKKDKKELVEGDHHHHVKKDRNEKVDLNQSLTVGQNQYEKVGQNHALDAGMQIHLKAGMTLILEAGVQLSLKVGGNFIDIGPAGVSIQGTMVMINSGGAAGSGSGSSPTAPQDAQEAKPARPDLADDAVTGQKSAP
jgi:type VI secretion system secreted protein VgrG